MPIRFHPPIDSHCPLSFALDVVSHRNQVTADALDMVFHREAVRLVMILFGSILSPALKRRFRQVFIDFIRLINMYYYTTVFI